MARKRAWWRRIDARGVIGVALVALAVAGTWLTVANAVPGTRFAVASRTLLPGDTIGAGDVRVVQAAVGESSERYLVEGETTVGMTVTETVAAGELVPRRTMTSGTDNGLARIVISAGGSAPAGIAAGTRVDLWRAAEPDLDVDAAPLVSGATIASVDVSSGLTGADDARTVEVIIPEDDVAAVITAQSTRGGITVVQSAGAER
ncbi:SAF domain-containing protein [Mycetocola reblochoni]|nr:SAF domain-containing protein [Mycetocola reblochoni]